jgi:hypothetical protein
MFSKELFDIEQRARQLPPEEQLELIGRLVRQLRLMYFTDHEALERGLRETAADPQIQAEIRNIDEEFRVTEADGLV